MFSGVSESTFQVQQCPRNQNLITWSVYRQMLLALQYGGISAEVNLMDGGAMVQLDQFSEGMTPVLIINHLTNTTVSLWQHNNDNKKV